MKRNYFSHWLLAVILVISGVADQATITPVVGHDTALQCGILSRIFKGAAKTAGKDAAKKAGKEAAKKAGKEAAKESAKKGTKDGAKQGAKDCVKKEATKVEGQPKPPHERGNVIPANKENGQSTPKNMQKQIDRGQAPKDVIRADPPHTPGERPHVHLKDKRVLCNDGKWKDGKEQPIPKDVQKWFEKNGWGEKKPEKPTIYSKEPKKPSPKDDKIPQ